MTNSRRGFTIVELLVVISIIGILATITFMGFGRYQQNTRDSARSAQAKIIAESLETYYGQNGEYPSCPALTGSAATVTTSVLSGVNQQALVTPQAAAGTTNSIQCADLTSMSQPDIFAYVGDGSTACTTGQACLSFQLKYKQETTGQIITINSRHKTTPPAPPPVTIPGTPSITASNPSSTSQINISWTATSNTTSYTLQQATNNTWTANLVSQTIASGTTASYSATGLSASTTYYYRLQALNGSTTGAWSNTASATTAAVYVPPPTPPPSAGGAPVYAGASSVSYGSSGAGGTNLVNYTTSCPSGSSPVNGTFYAYHADTGVTYNDTFGTADVLNNFGPTNPIYAQYYGAVYQCQNSYGTSGYSPASSTISIPVYM